MERGDPDMLLHIPEVLPLLSLAEIYIAMFKEKYLPTDLIRDRTQNPMNGS
jgi:hypothetical protein